MKPVIILVQPQLGENIGKTARAMANFGLDDLRLVAPRDGWPNPAAGPSAAGADNVLEKTQVFETLDQAIHDIAHLYAATVRPRDMNKNVVSPEAMAANMHKAAHQGETFGILFGPERSGLANPDILMADDIVTVPVNPEFGSLNLAQAVIICAYEWSKNSAEVVAGVHIDPDPKATKQELQGLFEHLEGALDESGYFRPASRRPALVETLRNLLQSAGFRRQQIHTLRGVIKSLTRHKF